MVNLTLLWMLLVPFIFSVITFFLIPKISNDKFTCSLQNRALICIGGLLVSCLILTITFYTGMGFKTYDTQILNGEIRSKHRQHGSYIETYSCNCRTVTSTNGSGPTATTTSTTVCDKCYRNHYTVTWSCTSNVGEWNIEHKDWTSQSVYNLPDPPRYTSIKIGDPASSEVSYKNYIKAVPESLFNPASEDVKKKYAGYIPSYPNNVYDFYKVDRVVGVGVSIPNVREWNDKLSVLLKKIGPQRQTNIVFVITKFDDENYFYALRDAWANGKKNDIVVVIGAPEFPKKASWVRIMALTDHDIFRVKLRDAIEELETIDVDSVLKVTDEVVMSDFKRKSMKDFKYLENEIDPPTWLLITAVILNILSYLAAYLYIAKDFREKYMPRMFKPNPNSFNRMLRKYNR